MRWVQNAQAAHTQEDLNAPISNHEERQWDKILNQRGVNTLMLPLSNKGEKDGTTIKTDITAGNGLDSFFNDSFFASMQIKRKQVFSNALHVKVKPLPGNTYLYGDFSIEASVDKTAAEPNKPINLTIHIKGRGNIDDIAPFNPSIGDVVIYADAPKVNASLNKETYEGEFSQHMALVGDKDFMIPSFKLSYFDAKTHTVMTQKTNPIQIHINGTVATSTPTLQKSRTNEPTISKEQKKPFSIKAYMSAIYSGLGILFVLAFSIWFTKKEKRIISHNHAL